MNPTVNPRPAGPPELQLLSNGRYHVMVTAAGGGSSRCDGTALTRWSDDASRDAAGAFCYVRDSASGQVVSTTFQPTLRPALAYDAAFLPGRVRIERRDGDTTLATDIAVAPADDVELRRIRVTNHAGFARSLCLTSYAEVVLGSAAGDADHPAFQKLFVQTEIDPGSRTILCTRRPQTPEDVRRWMFHRLVTDAAVPPELSCETDRMRFIGRGRSLLDPVALDDDAPLSGSAGAVLDPVVAIRCPLTLAANSTTTVTLVMGIAPTREECLALARKYDDTGVVNRTLQAAAAHALGALADAGTSDDEAHLYARLAAHVLYANGALRAPAAALLRNRLGQSGLWAHSISGDLPIALVGVSRLADIDLARQLMKAHAYWLAHGVVADLAVVDDGAADDGALHDRLAALAKEFGLAGAGSGNKGGRLFLLKGSALADADRVLLQSVSRIVLGNSGDASDAGHGDDGDDRDQDDDQGQDQGREDSSQQGLTGLARLARRLDATSRAASFVDASAPSLRGEPAPGAPIASPDPTLQFANGRGGFSANGREYVMTVSPGAMTPVPWVNVIANPSFGTLVSESGSASSWAENAQQFRLTPWSNDPVVDAATEAFYLRDEADASSWSPTLLPCAGRTPYVSRHGFGYSVFEHVENEIESSLTMHVAIDEPVKFVTIALRNTGTRARSLSVTGYVEWVLGAQAETSRMTVSTTLDPATGAILATNPYNTDFAGRTAFFVADVLSADTSFSADRASFLGHGGSTRRPAAMSTARLDGRVGAALDPCAAIRVPLQLGAGQSRVLVFRLGAGTTDAHARDLLGRLRGEEASRTTLAAVGSYWQRTLGALQVRTPDAALNLLANGWLLYQVLACRLWARTAFYQASGAFGFRDQLQDVMALVHARPEQVRAHLLLAASRQFPEGDAQHWWHPPSGRGVRTRVSDDYLWLPLATCRYVQATGDDGVLDEPVHFLQGRLLKDGEASNYDLAVAAPETGSLYEHCRRAIVHGLRFGAHGLPLMGTGDWNDGMNAVGAQGKGESVWLAFFLFMVLSRFAGLARTRGDADFAQRCEMQSRQLREAIDASAWDGAWYRRGWFDDGSPLGTSANAECRIDSIAQSWAVLSGAGSDARARAAMNALDAQLVSREDKLIKLLAPPFDRSSPSPGYIQGYVEGVRENGGQYTHAAVWAAMAFAQQGDARRAWELFDILCPIRHAETAADVATYMTEPYVVASDVYSTAGHVGRGGWTWYTGAAGWLYRCVTESLLGLDVRGHTLTVRPCVPADWTSYSLSYRHRSTLYEISVALVDGANGRPGAWLDGAKCVDDVVTLVDDGRPHRVEIRTTSVAKPVGETVAEPVANSVSSPATAAPRDGLAR